MTFGMRTLGVTLGVIAGLGAGEVVASGALLSLGKTPLVTTATVKRYGATLTAEDPVVKLWQENGEGFAQLRASNEYDSFVSLIITMKWCMYLVSCGTAQAATATEALLFTPAFEQAVGDHCAAIRGFLRERKLLLDEVTQPALENWWRMVTAGKEGVIPPPFGELQRNYQRLIAEFMMIQHQALSEVCASRYGLAATFEAPRA